VLFPAFAATRDEHRPGQLALIDVEAGFRGDEASNLPDGVIDLVFVMPDHRVLFVEAKCIGNPAVASTARAAVDEQFRIMRGAMDPAGQSKRVGNRHISKGADPVARSEHTAARAWTEKLLADRSSQRFGRLDGQL
jgi:hypothetical protein